MNTTAWEQASYYINRDVHKQKIRALRWILVFGTLLTCWILRASKRLLWGVTWVVVLMFILDLKSVTEREM